MSMKPGVTTWPVASIVPRRPGQARADGGNPVALDGHVGPPAGAPVPSITSPRG